jgi:hypothetical protein
MSGLFRRLSSRRSNGPEGEQPPAQAETGAADAPANVPAEPGGHRSLLVDPAAQTRVLRGNEAPTTFQRPGDGPAGEASSQDAATNAPAGTRGSADAATGGGGQPDTAAGAGGQSDAATSAYGGVGSSHGGPDAGHAHETESRRGAADPASTLHPLVLDAPGPGPGARIGEGPMIPVSDLPAGIDPDELAAAPPTSARRSRLRRRAGFLRAAREVLLRDLGGFVYELHRTAGDIEHEAHRRLREVKLARLTRLDAELHELEVRLDDVRRHVLVREPGVGGDCPRCGELFGSDAHYCAHCGLPLTESARRAVSHEAAPPALTAGEQPQPAEPHGHPTEEYSPLAADDPEFRWPPRAGAGDDQAAAPEARAAEPHHAGESPAAADAPATAGSDEPARTAGDDEGAKAEDARDNPAAAGEDPGAPGDARAEDDRATAGEGRGASEGATAEDDREDRATAGESPRYPATDGSAERAAGGADAAGRNGRDESVFRPVERRR